MISIHAPRVGSDQEYMSNTAHQRISIHAPRVGSDQSNHQNSNYTQQFQSTLPVWGATPGQKPA